jgi:hypothetical protein
MNVPLIGIHPLADSSGKPTGGGSKHRPLHGASRKSSQQRSSHHPNTASNHGAFDGLFTDPAGMMGQAFTLIQILTDPVGAWIAIRINGGPVTTLGSTPGKYQSNQYQKCEPSSQHKEILNN